MYTRVLSTASVDGEIPRIEVLKSVFEVSGTRSPKLSLSVAMAAILTIEQLSDLALSTKTHTWLRM